MASALTELSETLAGAVTAAGPFVARVEARRRVPASGIVWSRDGVIVTAHHVVEQDENITVGIGDGESVAAKLVGRDPATDIAVLRAQASGLAAAAWADADALRVGHIVMALGRPGKSVRATLGIVGAKGGAWRAPTGGQMDAYVQSDAAMYPGFSGGPLVDASGKAIGMNTSALSPGSSVAVPVATLRRIVESLLAHGKVLRGYLGIGTQPVRLPEALARQTGHETGLLVAGVEAGSPAERGGLMLGDTVVGMAGQPVRHLDDLQAQLGAERVGATVPVRIIRGGELREITVTIGERG